MPASRFLKIVKKSAKFQPAVSMCQFLSPGTTLYVTNVTTVLNETAASRWGSRFNLVKSLATNVFKA